MILSLLGLTPHAMAACVDKCRHVSSVLFAEENLAADREAVYAVGSDHKVYKHSGGAELAVVQSGRANMGHCSKQPLLFLQVHSSP